jgi:hypothetical protein
MAKCVELTNIEELLYIGVQNPGVQKEVAWKLGLVLEGGQDQDRREAQEIMDETGITVPNSSEYKTWLKNNLRIMPLT